MVKLFQSLKCWLGFHSFKINQPINITYEIPGGVWVDYCKVKCDCCEFENTL